MELSDNDNFKDIFILWDKSDPIGKWLSIVGMRGNTESELVCMDFQLKYELTDKQIPYISYPYDAYDYVLYNRLTNELVCMVNITRYNKIAGKVWNTTQGIKLFYNCAYRINSHLYFNSMDYELKLNFSTNYNWVEGNTLNDFYSFINDSVMDKNNILSKKEQSLKKIKSEYEPKIKRKLTL